MALTITEHPSVAAFSDIVALADPDALVPNKVYQRRLGSTVGDLVFKGTYTGSPATIYARIKRKHDNAVIKDWTALTSETIAGGNWSGTLIGVPQGDSSAGDATYGSAYYLEVSEDGSTVEDTSTVNFRVGICIMGWGQSNLGTLYTNNNDAWNALTYVAAHIDCWGLGISSNVWYRHSTTQQSQLWGMLNYIQQNVGCPVAFCIYAQGATPSYDFLPGNLWDTNAISGLGTGQQIFTAFGRKVEVILGHQGENDVNTAQVMTGCLPVSGEYPTAFFDDRLHELHDLFATYCGETVDDISWVQATLGDYDGSVSGNPAQLYESEGPTTDDTYGRFIDYLLRANDRYPTIYCGSTYKGETRRDTVHQSNDAGYRNGLRFGHAISTVLGETTGFAPYLSAGSVVSATVTDVTVTHGSGTDVAGKAGTSSLTGFQVWNGAKWLSATAVRTSATTIRVTTSENAPLTSARKVRYGCTTGGAGENAVIDNSSVSNLLMPTYVRGLDITPLYRVAVPRFVRFLYRKDAESYAAATMQTWTWTDSYLGATQADTRSLIIIVQRGSGSSVGVTSVTVTPDVGSPVAATLKTAMSGTLGLYYAEISGSAQYMDVTIVRPSNDWTAGYIWQVNTSDLASTTMSLVSETVSSQTSGTLTLTATDHCAAVGAVSHVVTNQNLPHIYTRFASSTREDVWLEGANPDFPGGGTAFMVADCSAGDYDIVYTYTDATGDPVAASFQMVGVVLESVYVDTGLELEPDAEVDQLTGGGRGKRKRKLYTFPDGTIGYATEQEAAAIVAEIPRKFGTPEVPKAEPIKISRNVQVARQQLSDLLPKLQSLDSEPARREATRLIRKMEEVQKRIDELEEEEIVMLITLLH
jgi:hypothetical protein